MKILLKSKSKNNYSESVSSLCKIMIDGAPENSILFYKKNGFQYIKEWIEILLVDTAT